MTTAFLCIIVFWLYVFYCAAMLIRIVALRPKTRVMNQVESEDCVRRMTRPIGILHLAEIFSKSVRMDQK